MQHSIDAARNNRGEIERSVFNWMGRVDEISVQVRDFHGDARHGRAGCTNLYCPNLWSRHQLSILARKMVSNIVEIQGEKKWIDKISYLPAPKWIGESRAKILNEIIEALKDPDINMIGVYGLGGVGKATLVKDVARKAQQDKLFNSMPMTIVITKTGGR
ncbi:Disease resistance protein [Quillaja saponaria]|uniref:Disease resistance protein n=1 Tax=Quillaja saponaria TaxID=32244 RepID=A0AAD7KP44_QUISA|nr:Disease resistance protein [Quillaja saponaria]